MQQQGLELITRIPYQAETFVLHSGIKESTAALMSALKITGFTSRLVTGGSRFGKTHFSIWLGSQAAQESLIPTYVDGKFFSSWLNEVGAAKNWSKHDVVLVDDIDLYFMKTSAGESGAFVNFYEKIRLNGAKLFLFSTKDITEFPCDQHILSRLNASYPVTINHPDMEDMEKLLMAMALQRGIKLKEKKLSFVKKRVKREIPAIENYLHRILHLSQVFGAKVGFGLLQDAV